MNNFRVNSIPKNRKLYLVLDTETATLPFGKDLEPKAKQILATSKPLVYDLGWQLVDSKGTVYSRHSILIQETFYVPSIFDTSYYKDKKPLYMDKLENDGIVVMTWKQATDELLKDLELCSMVLAYNSAFDFKKAIPFTEKYINALYSREGVDKFISNHKWHFETKILNKNSQKKSKTNNAQTKEKSIYEYDNSNFDFRGKKYPLGDLWGIACNRLINIRKYKSMCLKNNMVSASGEFFSTSAESTFRYLINNYNFKEEHTALSDVIIETEILLKALKKGKINVGVAFFPFRELGTTVQYIGNEYKTKMVNVDNINLILNKFKSRQIKEKKSPYDYKILSYISVLENIKEQMI